MVETNDWPVYCHNVEAEQDMNPWYHDIKTFMKDGGYPVSANAAEKRTLRKLAPADSS